MENTVENFLFKQLYGINYLPNTTNINHPDNLFENQKTKLEIKDPEKALNDFKLFESIINNLDSYNLKEISGDSKFTNEELKVYLINKFNFIKNQFIKMGVIK